MPDRMLPERFRVAFSFAGEQRENTARLRRASTVIVRIPEPLDHDRPRVFRGQTGIQDMLGTLSSISALQISQNRTTAI